jgi:hypothetical protein
LGPHQRILRTNIIFGLEIFIILFAFLFYLGNSIIKKDPFVKKRRELDIITKRCIIEVKSGKKPKGLKQFLAQKRYAEALGKKHIVFAPNILTMAKISHEKNGIFIVKDFKTLIDNIKESEK